MWMEGSGFLAPLVFHASALGRRQTLSLARVVEVRRAVEEGLAQARGVGLEG